MSSPRYLYDVPNTGCSSRCQDHAREQDCSRSYKTIKYRYSKPAKAVPNRLKQQFVTEQPDEAWVTDITYIRTFQGWLYLAVVLDLFSRKVIGWSMKSTLAKEIVLDAVLMAVWRRQPTQLVMIHSDQGSQYSSDEWKRFCD